MIDLFLSFNDELFQRLERTDLLELTLWLHLVVPIFFGELSEDRIWAGVVQPGNAFRM